VYEVFDNIASLLIKKIVVVLTDIVYMSGKTREWTLAH